MPGSGTAFLCVGITTYRPLKHRSARPGGVAETQEAPDFCAEHGILPQVRMIRVQDIHEASGCVDNVEVRFRYVIDMASGKE